MNILIGHIGTFCNKCNNELKIIYIIINGKNNNNLKTLLIESIEMFDKKYKWPGTLQKPIIKKNFSYKFKSLQLSTKPNGVFPIE